LKPHPTIVQNNIAKADPSTARWGNIDDALAGAMQESISAPRLAPGEHTPQTPPARVFSVNL